MTKRAMFVATLCAAFTVASIASLAAERKKTEVDERIVKAVNKSRTAQQPASQQETPQAQTQQSATTTPTQTEPIETAVTFAPAAAAAAPAAGEQIKWQVIGAGGGSSSSASYKMSATLGQTAAGPIASASYKVNQGFWQNFVTSCCTGPTRGNVNNAGIIDLSDLSMLIAYLTVTPKPVLPCPDAANVNAAGIIDLSDLSMLIAYLTVTPKPVLPPC